MLQTSRDWILHPSASPSCCCHSAAHLKPGAPRGLLGMLIGFKELLAGGNADVKVVGVCPFLRHKTKKIPKGFLMDFRAKIIVFSSGIKIYYLALYPSAVLQSFQNPRREDNALFNCMVVMFETLYKISLTETGYFKEGKPLPRRHSRPAQKG